ncbi:MAG TPA: bifunctional methylenetetrahydrofolate dehydrogenase/methenyltetrahydrofolate cyclohydrolase FolD [Stellaceae bacterium]|nr:bifunctional methylenetetrahydrofolate dehydrogenase/methenyltetrahydrofolate cyclohydrolase FolD [Stellaceae bacterium]
MASRIIDGKAEAARLRERVAGARQRLGLVPGLATILVGHDPASEVYVRSKVKASGEAGFLSREHRLPVGTAQSELLALIERLNRAEEIDGILVQLPLPQGIDQAVVIASLDPAKDVDGFHPQNVGQLWSGGEGLVPCTPMGALMLARIATPTLAGARAVILGRSAIVGKPMAALLLSAQCTVTVAHSQSRDLPALIGEADLVVAAVGKPELVRGAWLKPGATVIDVGINRVAGVGGKSTLVGDVAFAEAVQVAGAITPVPGGVGPMTIACLLRNTLIAACRRRHIAISAAL